MKCFAMCVHMNLQEYIYFSHFNDYQPLPSIKQSCFPALSALLCMIRYLYPSQHCQLVHILKSIFIPALSALSCDTISVSQHCQLSHTWYSICIPALWALSYMIWYLNSSVVMSFIHDMVSVSQHYKVSHAWYWLQQHHRENTVTAGGFKATLGSLESQQLLIQSSYDVNQATHIEFGHQILYQWLGIEIWCLIMCKYDRFALNRKVLARETMAVKDTTCSSHENGFVLFKCKIQWEWIIYIYPSVLPQKHK